MGCISASSATAVPGVERRTRRAAESTYGRAVTDAREFLRSLPVFDGALPAFDAAAAPGSPVELYLEWLRHAVASGVPEPHAVTVSTVDGGGRPDARVVILKDVGPAGWSFASSTASAKGRQLAAVPAAALTSYWIPLGRQVRVRGTVQETGPAAAAADFLARSPDARAEALLERQSQVVAPGGDAAADLAAARARLDAEPGLVARSWRVYLLVPEEVEFWQASKARLHTRLRYRRDGDSWVRERLWA